MEQQFTKALSYYDIELSATGFTAQLEFTYSDEDIVANGFTEEDLRVSYFDGTWHAMQPDINTLRSTLTVTTDHFSLWAITEKDEPLITSVDREDQMLPSDYRLAQNYPNPFNPVTTIKYELPKTEYVTLTVYNITGQVVAKLANRTVEAGYHEAIWDASNLASGVYIYRLTAGNFTSVKRMLLVK